MYLKIFQRRWALENICDVWKKGKGIRSESNCALFTKQLKISADLNMKTACHSKSCSCRHLVLHELLEETTVDLHAHLTSCYSFLEDCMCIIFLAGILLAHISGLIQDFLCYHETNPNLHTIDFVWRWYVQNVLYLSILIIYQSIYGIHQNVQNNFSFIE